MKKLMIALGAVALAVSANAAAYTWQIQNIAQYGTDSTKITKTNAANKYLIMCMFSADGTISATMDSGTFNAGADKIIAQTAVTGTGGTGTMGKEFTSDNYGNGTYYYVVLLNTKGTSEEAVSTSSYDYYALSTTLEGDPAAVSPNVPLSLQWTTGTEGYVKAYTQVVPEPTSGLLLLLGVAGLALRRRRA